MNILQEYLKPVFSGNDAAAIRTAQITLYRALDVSLRLLSPFMPFITEELYQRLPRSTSVVNKIPSICVAPYPDKEKKWKNVEIEREVEFVQKIAKNIRSARSDYNLPNKTKSKGNHVLEVFIYTYTLFSVFIMCTESNTEHLVKKYVDFLQTLAYCSTVEVNTSVPDDCKLIPISDKCEVHLLLKGLIDVSVEVEKLQKRADFLLVARKKLSQEMSDHNYNSKVPEDIQKTNLDKLIQMNVELDKIESVMVMLKLID